jgi:phenylalanyl-tRNA synthetase beta chain
MKLSLSWLKQHLETEADASAIAERLTALGLEVEAIDDKSAALRPFVVAHVVEAVKHPNADKLRVCKVDAGSGIVQVVCGAPNARTGMKGVFAPPGTHIPGTGLDLKVGNIRGVDSNGMLCSARELNLGEDHDGIIELPEDAPVGTSFAAYRQLDDSIFEIKITPDRGDCLGVHGIARDLSASGFGQLKKPAEKRVPGSFKSPIQWRIADDAAKGCPLVAGRYFRNVKNGPSPQWLQERLTAIGLRPISALVDITNFVTYDLGRPLHVFDADRVKGDLVMRQARQGEELLALDGKTHRLQPGTIVIADDRGPAAIGGIMGGEATGCQLTTTNMFLEVALFDAITVAKAGRALGILSDARYRFERGVDPASVEWGIDVATRLVTDICGGEVSEITSAGALPALPAPIEFRPARVRGLVGVDVTPDRQHAILAALGFKIAETTSDRWRGRSGRGSGAHQRL